MEQNCLFIKPEKYEEAINALRERGFDIMDLVNGVKITETAPKYDPSRKFRKGDKVRVVEWNGRDIARVGQIGYVVSDEYNSRVELGIDGWKNSVYYPACHLELVTPVEEQGPYSVRHNEAHAAWSIYGPFGLSAVNYFYGERYPYTNETAKVAAEAERDRLNAEYSKEQK
jgi:hypothetical protein